ASLLAVLILAATPIGNLADASDRLKQAIEKSEHIACEDTRSFKQLASALGLRFHARLYSLHDHNEKSRLDELVEIARAHDLLVVSDAGMPTISDPGFNLVRSCIDEQIEVSVIPGASSVLGALAISGLPTDRFVFEGFLPRKKGERSSVFRSLENETRTMIFFEAPHRILDALTDAAEVFGPEHQAVVVRELTKKFEEVVRGKLSELIDWAQSEPKGEMVLLLAGASRGEANYEVLAQRALALAQTGIGLKQAVGEVAKESGASKSVIYEHALKLKP
ncbi:MAG: 16S rRNA (cytidine(1402)-2'-O)-methyltransferase, partial [Aquiluna sp.]